MAHLVMCIVSTLILLGLSLAFPDELTLRICLIAALLGTFVTVVLLEVKRRLEKDIDRESRQGH